MALVSIAPVTSGAQIAAVTSSAAATQRDRTIEIQMLLSRLGYNAGSADGIAGRRTVEAILMFQKNQGLPPTGLPTDELVRQLRLTATGQDRQPPAPAAQPTKSSSSMPESWPESLPDQPADRQPEVLSTGNGTAESPSPAARALARTGLTGTRWKIVDASGAKMTVLLDKDGRVGDIPNDRFWRWQQNAQALTLTYEDGWGARIVRTGVLAGTFMTGIAKTHDGKTWHWQAELQPEREKTSPFSAAKPAAR